MNQLSNIGREKMVEIIREWSINHNISFNDALKEIRTLLENMLKDKDINV
jgi:sialic acid synthase SpsE